MDSKGVAEYLRALVVTDAISDYLPDDESGKPSSLPLLVIMLPRIIFLFRFPVPS